MESIIKKLGKTSITVEKDYHSSKKEYNKLTVVEEEGTFKTYLSRKPVPVGVALTNREYWICFSGVLESITFDYLKFKRDYASGNALEDNSIITRHILDRNIKRIKIALKAISEEEIDDNAIIERTIKDRNVTSNKIAQENILTEHFAKKSVITAILADYAVTAIKLADNSVTTRSIANENITDIKLANNAVTTRSIAQESIIEEKFANNSVSTRSLIDESVTKEKLAKNSVTESKIADNNITNRKIANNAIDITKFDSYTRNIIESVRYIPEEFTSLKEAIFNEINKYKPIIINGDVTNAADEEDITSENNLLKLKDRSALNGMGYVILRKNKSFAEQVTKKNTIYEIRYDFDLNGAEITVPSNCILEFDGGSLSSGTIIFTDTLLYGNIKFSNIVATGTITNNSITPKDFGALGDGVTNDTVAFQSAINVCNNIHVTAGTYILSLSTDIKNRRYIFIDRSNVHIKMDSDAVLKADETALEELSYFRTMIIVKGPGVVNNTDTRIENITIEGGKIIGSRSQYNLPDGSDRGENYCGIAILFCNNVTIKNCIITDCAGDCIYTAAVDNLRVENVTGLRFRRSAVSVGLDNGVLIKECTFDKPAPITYDNGNTSSGTSVPYTISFEPEPYYLRKISDKPIQNVIIENNTFIYEAALKYGRYIEGCVSGITIRKNIFKNASKYDITLQPLNSYGSNGICENALIEENTIEGLVYSEGSTTDNAVIYTYCNGSITIRNNKVSNTMLVLAKNYTTLIIENNETTGWEHFAMDISDIKGSNVKTYIKGNISEANCIFSISKNSVQDVYINDNIFLGSATSIGLTEYFCYVGESPSNVYIENNKATIKGRFIVVKKFNNTGKLLLNGNYFDCYPTESFLVFDMNGNYRYVNADIINNYIRTTINATLSVKDFTGKMSVINNVFAGAETKFTEDTIDTDHLKINNNVYIG